MPARYFGGVEAKILELRELLAGRFPTAPRKTGSCFPSGVECVDEVGLPRGAISELSSSPAGGALFLQSLLASAFRQKCFCALIDGGGSFSPANFPHLSHLLWVQCREAAEAIRAADLLIHDGNLPLLILDLQMNPPAQLRRIPTGAWYRLERHLEETTSALVTLTPQPLVACARVRLSVENRWSLADLREPRAAMETRLKISAVARRHYEQELLRTA